MLHFQDIAHNLIKISFQIIEQIKVKNQYAQTINYQINDLLQKLYHPQHHKQLFNQQGLSRQGQYPFNNHKLTIITSKKLTVKLTIQDICNYLHINRQNMKRNHSFVAITQEQITAFHSIIEKDESIQNQLVQILRQIDLKLWFSQVDFFNNGYIDTTALYEYFLHYDNNMSSFQQYNALLIIKIIKKKDHNDKIFIQDLNEFISLGAQFNVDSANQQNQELSLKNTFQLNNTLKHPQKHSFCINSNSSDASNSVEHTNKFIPKILQINYIKKNLVIQRSSNQHYQLIDEQIRKQSNITYEQRLMKMHPRNTKYIKQAKVNMETIIPICNIQIQSFFKLQNTKISSSDIINKIKNIADTFNKIIFTIKQFINKQEKFTFFNAFALADKEESNCVNLANWKAFIKQIGVKVSQRSVDVFFKTFSVDGIMNFSQYTKIFKYKATEDQYCRCLSRYPFIHQQLPQKMRQSYRILLSSLIKLRSQQVTLLKHLNFHKVQLINLLSQVQYKQELIQLLSSQYSQYVNQYFQYFNIDSISNYLKIE